MSDEVKCPHCAEMIKAEATKCKHCQSEIKKAKPMGAMQKGCFAFFAFAILWSFVSPSEPRVTPRESSPPPKGAQRVSDTSSIRVGNVVTVTAESAFAAVDDEAWDALNEAAVADDKVGVRDLVLNGKVFLLSKGESVKVLELGFESTKIRVVDGANTESVGWVLTNSIK